MKVNPDL